jgi:hypothetical protein
MKTRNNNQVPTEQAKHLINPKHPIISRLLCWLGIHRYKWALVYSKKDPLHCIGIEEINYYKKPHWIDGRQCKHCEKKQYFYYFFVTCGWKDVF